MTMADVIEISGLDELAEDFRIVARKYPDRAGEELRKSARALRKDLVNLIIEKTQEQYQQGAEQTVFFGSDMSHGVSGESG